MAILTANQLARLSEECAPRMPQIQYSKVQIGAAMQAIEAHMSGITLEEQANKHKELAEALQKWGHDRPV